MPIDEDLPDNSNKQHEPKRVKKQEPEQEEKKVERVVAGEVIQRKKGIGKRIRETFTGENNQSVFDYMVFDILIPAARDMFVDATTAGIERKFYGTSRPPSRRGGYRGGASEYGRVEYNRMSSSRRDPRDDPRDRDRSMSRRSRARHDFGEIVIPTRVEAEEVIDKLFELISKFEVATVADLYDLVGVTGAHTDNKWGWFDLRGAGVERVRGGYLLDLPRPEPID